MKNADMDGTFAVNFIQSKPNQFQRSRAIYAAVLRIPVSRLEVAMLNATWRRDQTLRRELRSHGNPWMCVCAALPRCDAMRLRGIERPNER